MSAGNPTDSPRPALKVAAGTSDVDGVRVLRLLGEFDGATPRMPELVAQALAVRPVAIVLDLSEVDFLGSAALSILVDTRHRADRLGVQLCLVANRRVTLLPLELTGLTRMFPVYATIEDALSQLRGNIEGAERAVAS